MLTRVRKHVTGEALFETRPVPLGRTLGKIETLTRKNRDKPDPARERKLLRLRQLAGIGFAEQAGERAQVVEPDFERLPDGSVPEVTGESLTAGVIRAGILGRGALLVRGLVPEADASALAEAIDGAVHAHDEVREGRAEMPHPAYAEIREIPPNHPVPNREVVAASGGVLAVDAPRAAFLAFDLMERAGLPGIIADYLNETPAVSAEKTTLRKAAPDIPGGWHQDGRFLGDVNSVNLWLSLSHCGEDAPGMDLVPRRLDEIVETDVERGGLDAIAISQEQAEELAGDEGIATPVFRPGDALFFDHMYLHKTGSREGMTKPRFALESWFFGPSAFPAGYMSLAL
jgi:hypothetical protein